jgi:cytochrome c2
MHDPCTLRARVSASTAHRKACGKAVCALVGLCCATVALAAAAQDAERGRRLLTQYQCGSCHAIPGVAAATGRSAPTLAAFGRRSYIAGQAPNEGDALVRWIIAPRAVVPDATMPAMGAGEADARDMAAYLQRLR